MTQGRSADDGPAPASTARVHVVGLLLLALLLQALSPLLHARLQAVHAALTGQRIDVAAFCLPGHVPAAPAGQADGTTPPAGLADCQLCQGSTAPVADLPPLPAVSAPSTARAAATVAASKAWTRAGLFPSAHRPRGPPVV